MSKEPSYYAVLGLQPQADAAAIAAAYRGRSLKFRVKQINERGAEQAGPTQEQIEQAYAVLGDPDSRARYDAKHFPAKHSTVKRRRRIPIWLWAIIGVWAVALSGVVVFSLRSRTQIDGGAIGRIAGQTATIVVAREAGGAATVPPSGGGVSGGSPTIVAALPPATATSTPLGATATVVAVSTATATVAPTIIPSATQTTGPTATVMPSNTATAQPPTATTAPPPTAVPPTAVPPIAEPPIAEPPTAEPEPTATPSFRATDRIGTSLSVNLRNGPGAAYPSLGLLPTGTLLQATGATATVGGQLWRRFLLQDGRVGWVRDLDVLAAR